MDSLENIDVCSATDPVRERVLVVVGVEDNVELVAGEDAAEEGDDGDENEGNTDPNTRFALAREASFFNPMSIRDSVFGCSEDRGARRSKGTKPAG